MMNEERMLFWMLVKSLKRPENLQESHFIQQEDYKLKDIKLIVTDSGFTNKIIANGLVAIDSGTSFEMRNGTVQGLKGLVGAVEAVETVGAM